MFKQQIIDAIQNQEWLRITFQRKRDDAYVRVKFKNRTKNDIISLWNDFELNAQNVLNQNFGKLLTIV